MRGRLSLVQSVTCVIIYSGGSLVVATLSSDDVGYGPRAVALRPLLILSTLLSGLLIGALALGIELWILRHYGRWPLSDVWFTVRQMLGAALWMTLAYLGSFIVAVLSGRLSSEPAGLYPYPLSVWLLILIISYLRILGHAIPVALCVGWWVSRLLTNWTQAVNRMS